MSKIQGQAPPAPRWGTGRERWLDHAAIVAAFRDQYPPALDDPTKPLGPHPEPAPDADPAHRTAHTAAALALALGYDLAHPTAPDQVPRHGDEALTDRQAETLRQVTVDAYRSLPQPQKMAVATTLFARLGTLPATAERADPETTRAVPESGIERPAHDRCDAQIMSGLDEAVTRPAAARHLLRALQAHGIIAGRDVLPEPPTYLEPAGRRQPRTSRPNGPATRSRPKQRPERVPRWSPAQAPAPAAPAYDYSPRPGARPQPGPDGQPRPRW